MIAELEEGNYYINHVVQFNNMASMLHNVHYIINMTISAEMYTRSCSTL